ncbi:hypothetical protein AB0K35_28030 [Micromonospora sp. NPDC053740]|uniref:hypothetical protein n=1 Tax=Micromonospora sp. NPDC053740 TaxID=3155173 RepID=UPI0034390522
MSKVVLEAGVASGEYHLFVDGVDIGPAIKEKGVYVRWEGSRPLVEVELLPSNLRLDLPDAIVRVVEGLS